MTSYQRYRYLRPLTCMGRRLTRAISNRANSLTRHKPSLSRASGRACPRSANWSRVRRCHTSVSRFRLQPAPSRRRGELTLPHRQVRRGLVAGAAPVVTDSFGRRTLLCRTSSSRYASRRRSTPSTQPIAASIKPSSTLKSWHAVTRRWYSSNARPSTSSSSKTNPFSRRSVPSKGTMRPSPTRTKLCSTKSKA